MTVIAVSTSGGCHAFYVSNALAVLSIFTYVSDALSARTYAFEKNLRRVNSDMQSGEVTIYEPDSPEVAGVYINQPNVTEP